MPKCGKCGCKFDFKNNQENTLFISDYFDKYNRCARCLKLNLGKPLELYGDDDDGESLERYIQKRRKEMYLLNNSS